MIKNKKITSLIAFLVLSLMTALLSGCVYGETTSPVTSDTPESPNVKTDDAYAQLINNCFNSDEPISEEDALKILSYFLESPTEMITEFQKLSSEQQGELFTELCNNLTEDDMAQFEKTLYALYEIYGIQGEEISTLECLQNIYTQSPIYVSKFHIKLYDPLTRWESWILLGEEDEAIITSVVKDSSRKILLSGFADTTKYFFPMDIIILFPDIDSDGETVLVEYSIFTNEQGEKVLSLQDNDVDNSFLATEECNELISIISERNSWNYVTMSQLNGLEKAQLFCNEDILAEITDNLVANDRLFQFRNLVGKLILLFGVLCVKGGIPRIR